MTFILYQAQNLANGHRYVGITGRRLGARKSQHLWSAKNGSQTRLASAIRKYGVEKIEFSILRTLATRQEVIHAEIEFIETHRPEYNVTKGGDGAVGVVVGPETRKKLSLAIKARLERDGNWWKGRKHSPEAAEAMRARRVGTIGHWRGKTRPPETVEKFRAAKLRNPVRYWLGKKRSPETIQKIIETKAARRSQRGSVANV